jgi:hypothetical protein
MPATANQLARVSGADCISSDAVNTSRPSHHPMGMKHAPRHTKAITDNRPACDLK